MPDAILKSKKLITEESETAYALFLKNLKVKVPKELVLVNPQLVPEEHFDKAIAKNRGYFAFPPTGLLYLAAAAHQVIPELEIKIVDLNYEVLKQAQEESQNYKIWQSVLNDALETCQAPFLGITCMFGSTKPVFVEVAKWLRKYFSEIPILAGGVQATYDAEELLENDYCDIVFRRESEMQLKILLQNVSQKSKGLPYGVAFRVQSKTYLLGDPQEASPVDWDIRPYYDKINITDYYRYGSLGPFSRFNGLDKPFATVLSNRGCRARCTFCTVRDFNGFGVRQRDLDHVVEEIKYLVEKKKIKQIDWLDDDLLMNPERTVTLFKRIAKEVPELEWVSNNGLIAAAITDEIMEWMVKSGMKAFKIGIESGNDEMLHKIKKPTTKRKLRTKRALFQQYPDVFASGNFILGFPNETFAQMLDTYHFADELKWDWSSMYICQPLKGTEMFSSFQELGDERTEVENYDKTLNPGRSAKKGEFGHDGAPDSQIILSGMDIFTLPKDEVPSLEQIKEIWFTFNLVVNFFKNPNFQPDGSPKKMVMWFKSIAYAYPYDASMCAGLAQAYQLLKQTKETNLFRTRFIEIIRKSNYWQKRVKEFPDLLKMANVNLNDIQLLAETRSTNG
jgi:radical SAM superfamily enzyme YgiQ (UPF0313 family)